MDKKKIQYLKENFLFGCFWNITMIPLISIPISYINFPMWLKIGLVVVIYISLVLNTINEWYLEERINNLENQIKELTNK